MRIDEHEFKLPEREEKILEFWERNHIFEKTLMKTRKGKPFVFYEGPPTANAAPGIHHVEARSFKDVIPRYQTMRGRYVGRKAGWDTHGLPVEIQVEKALGLKSKKDIERYGIARFNAKCRESVWQFKTEWEKLTKRIGFWLDLEHPYITYETSYIETLWWIIKEFWKKKLLYQDFKVVPWCPRCQTGLSTHELGQGYERVRDRSVYVKFKLKPGQRIGSFVTDEQTYILAWTTTPWTLPGNVALAVNPELSYVRVQVKFPAISTDEKPHFVVLERHRQEDWSRASSGFLPPYREFKGQELVGLEYEPLFKVAELHSEKSYRIYAADFVGAEEGTGVVHTAVMYGEDDYALGTRVGLPKFHTVTETGHFIKELGEGLGGLPVKDPKTEGKIIASLKRRRLLFREERYEHDYPHCWRCDTALLYYAREGWWVKMSAKRKELIAHNEKINWVPAHLKRGRFGEFLREVRDWAFSRERYWGTPLPVWQCTKCKHHEVVGSLDELSGRLPKSGNRYLAVRHGQSETQLLGIADDDRKTYHLTPRGRSEIERRARLLRRAKIDLIIASPIQRTRESAEILSRILGAPVVYDDRLREINVGVFEHKPTRVYHTYFSSTLEKFTKRPPEGESLDDLKKRLMDFMGDLESKRHGKTILLVSHDYPLWILWGASQGLSNEEMAAVKDRKGSRDFVPTAGILEILFRPLPRDESGEVNLHRPYADAVPLVCSRCRGAMRRVPEVVDVWFDSGAMPFAQHHYPFAFGKKQETRSKKQAAGALSYPADYICEAVDQTRGWFYTLLAVATALGCSAPYRNVISLGHVLDRHGQKMSKSKGNVVDPWEMIQKYGADTIRWYFYTVNAPGDPKRFDEKDLLLKLRGALATFWNSFVFFDTYVGKAPSPKLQAPSSRNALDRWALMKLDQLTREVAGRLDGYDIVGAARALDAFVVEDFSNWYLRRSRRRFQKPESRKEKGEAATTTASVLLRLVELMAPFTPFLAEIMYQELKPKLGLHEESVHLRRWPASKPQAPSPKLQGLLEDMAEVRRLATLALAERAKAGIRVRQPLQRMKVKSLTLKGRELSEVLKDEVNVKEVVAEPKLSAEVELDTAITPALREEGLVRELVRHIQEMRRDLGLRPGEGARCQVLGDRELGAVIERWRAVIRREIGARTIEIGGKKQFQVEREMKLDGRQAWIGISRTRR